MTSAQYRLYQGILRLFQLFGTGGSLWAGVRTSGGTPATAPTMSTLDLRTIRFCQNNRVAQVNALPSLPIFTAPWWGVASADVDIQAGDVYSNGAIAFLVTGKPDSSQGFLVIPATETQPPLNHTGGGAYQAGLRIGAW